MGAIIHVSKLDPAGEASGQKLFIPWSTPGEASAAWSRLSKDHVPVYNQRKLPNLSRDLYIPNPGIGYWVLGGLTRERLLQTHAEKLRIKDTLISASVFVDAGGREIYWALWAPASHAELLLKPMAELGISQARIEFSAWDELVRAMSSANPVLLTIAGLSLFANLLLLLIIFALILSGRLKHRFVSLL